MPWLILIISAVFEAGWATALGHSDGLRDPVAVAFFLVALVISLRGLAWAMRSITVSVAYCVWVSIGAVLTVTVAMATGTEPASPVRALLIAGVIACVAGLKVLSKDHAGGPGVLEANRGQSAESTAQHPRSQSQHG